jgi:hypothetical protein
MELFGGNVDLLKNRDNQKIVLERNLRVKKGEPRLSDFDYKTKGEKL